MWGRDSYGAQDPHAHAALSKADNQQGPMHSSGSSAQVLRQAGREGSLGEHGHMCACGRVPLLSA